MHFVLQMCIVVPFELVGIFFFIRSRFNNCVRFVPPCQCFLFSLFALQPINIYVIRPARLPFTFRFNDVIKYSNCIMFIENFNYKCFEVSEIEKYVREAHTERHSNSLGKSALVLVSVEGEKQQTRLQLI